VYRIDCLGELWVKLRLRARPQHQQLITTASSA